jgi:hypothetical protein
MNSFVKIYSNDFDTKLIIYNLGIVETKWIDLQSTFCNKNIVYNIFDYKAYPSFFNININAGEYAWKPVLIYLTSQLYNNEIIIWMDSGNIIHKNLIEIYNHIKIHGVHTSLSSGNIQKWTHILTLKYMDVDPNIYSNICRNAACVGFNMNILWVKDFLKEWHDLALIKECIAPNGSSRKNHRQDQAILTILYYKYKKHHNFNDNIHDIGYSIQQDVKCPLWLEDRRKLLLIENS